MVSASACYGAVALWGNGVCTSLHRSRFGPSIDAAGRVGRIVFDQEGYRRARSLLLSFGAVHETEF